VRALTIWQPWAALIVGEQKRVETRAWAAPASVVGTRVAIHAAKTPTNLPVAREQPFAAALMRAAAAGPLNPDEPLPLGAFIGSAVIARVEEMDGLTLTDRFSTEERAFGNYAHGHYAWHLTDVHALARPVPCKGAQGLWTVPPDLVSRLVP
jgi:hypothetical protein